jgi:metallo-beta-lactamase family protein
MLEGGRIQDHLYHNIQNYYANILFIGYCAKGTLGRRLLDGAPIVKINGRDLSVFAGIKQTDLFSAHADHEGLITYIKSPKAKGLKKVFLVHGEPESMEALQANVELMGINAEIAKKGEVYQL